MTRSRILKALLILAFALDLTVASTARASDAASPQGATEFIKTLSEQVAAIRALENENLPETKRAALRNLIRIGFDLDATSQFVLGKFWGRAPAEQRAEFKDLFTEYLLNTYASHLNGYRIDTLAVVAGNRVAEDDFLVQTSIERATDTGNAVWRVRARDSEYRIIDVVIDRISFALTHRSEFVSIISRGGLEKMLEVLRERTSARANFGHQLLPSERIPRISLLAFVLVSPGTNQIDILLHKYQVVD